MDLYKSTDYRILMTEKIRSYPQHGYGVQGKLAQFIQTASSSLTGVLNGQREITPEQALKAAQFFEFDALETDYFLTLVDENRAGTADLKTYLKNRLTNIRETAAGLRDRPGKSAEISQDAKSVFYSDWKYSAVRIASFLPDITASKISQRLNIRIETVHRILEFLLSQGLVAENEDRTLKAGPAFTRVRANDPLVYRHHSNWREKVQSAFSEESPNNMHVTAPAALSAEDAEKAKKLFAKTLEDFFATIEKSPSEEVWCVNLDWFRVDSAAK